MDQLAFSGLLPYSQLDPRLQADQYRLSTLMPPRYSAQPAPGAFPDDGIVHLPQQMPDEFAESIDNWRRSVPSRMEREDPFGNDGFEERPSTRVVSIILYSSFVLSYRANTSTYFSWGSRPFVSP